jgi:formylglycine-generating enzyme required for sulfatase activity
MSDSLAWATVLENAPDPAVVTDSQWRARLVACGLPWRVRHSDTGIEMLLVPPGSFTRGRHEISLTNAFYLGRYPVTQAEWEAHAPDGCEDASEYFSTLESDRVASSDVPSRPVNSILYWMAGEFACRWGLRLPTEAEWEYACRAGTDPTYILPDKNDDPGAYRAHLDRIAWWQLNSDDQTHPVGRKRANALGFHDMLGNVWEWCSGRWIDDLDSLGSETDPSPGTDDWHDEQERPIRGGSYEDDVDAGMRECFGFNQFDNDIAQGMADQLGVRFAKTP